jgi:hypothetical protein
MHPREITERRPQGTVTTKWRKLIKALLEYNI